uniref:Uncharacterized protein n=1 Tax=Janibacter limosus TaxID=53458 RepID=A0AC61U4P7_9MICO|nr:penicillin-binding transpeptidase domain-containing protein [Janibacter limosus]
MIRGPSLYDPALGEEQTTLATGRWNYVLDGMVSQGWMTAAERRDQTFPKTTAPKRNTAKSNDIGFITEEVRTELRNRLKLSDADIDRGGFKIVTTIDKKAQRAAAKAVKNQRPTGERTSDLHIGLASVQPNDGAIRAMYGGAKFSRGKYGYFNSAVDGKMQAGSTMKPFTMIAALRKGLPLSTTYSGASPYYNKAFVSTGAGTSEIQRNGGVVNYGNASYGPVTMRTATQKSINTYYAQLNLAVTPKSTAKSAKDAGVVGWNGDKRARCRRPPPMSSGTDAVRVIDMANAYATIAAEGRRATPYYIASVKSTGEYKLDYKVKKDVRRAFPQDVARDAIRGMSPVDKPGGTGYPTVADLGRPVGGKTGTTSNNYAARFDGFTPGQLATAVGMYKGDGRLVEKNQLVNLGGFAEITGGTIPARIWTDYMIRGPRRRAGQEPPAGRQRHLPAADRPAEQRTSADHDDAGPRAPSHDAGPDAPLDHHQELVLDDEVLHVEFHVDDEVLHVELHQLDELDDEDLVDPDQHVDDPTPPPPPPTTTPPPPTTPSMTTIPLPTQPARPGTGADGAGQGQ